MSGGHITDTEKDSRLPPGRIYPRRDAISFPMQRRRQGFVRLQDMDQGKVKEGQGEKRKGTALGEGKAGGGRERKKVMSLV